jgi:hypothetical protein
MARKTPRQKALEVLGLPNRPSAEETKKAFREMAKQWHPDRCKLPEAATRYQEVVDAYRLLEREFATPPRAADWPGTRWQRSSTAPTPQKRIGLKRPKLDTSSEAYQKIKKVSELVLGRTRVGQIESTVLDTQSKVEELFDLLGIDEK